MAARGIEMKIHGMLGGPAAQHQQHQDDGWALPVLLVPAGGLFQHLFFSFDKGTESGLKKSDRQTQPVT